jgi:hypothetical protein
MRNINWLPEPTIGNEEEVIYGLMSILKDESNFISFRCSGNYTVDWGDGCIEDYKSGKRANHSYEYCTISNDSLQEDNSKQVYFKITPMNKRHKITSMDFMPNQNYHSTMCNCFELYFNTPHLEKLSFDKIGKNMNVK